jgi:dTDP-3-amino-3,4,6-trideoxy-alpha-D-glucose transaminase
MNVPFLDVGAAHAELRAALDQAYARVLDSGQYILGEELRLFEEEFASFASTRHCIGVGNGLDALTIALRARGIGPGDEVVVPAHTFVATWIAVVLCGAALVPVDVDPDRLLIDVDAVAAACTPRTAAIVPVHLYGHPVDPSPLEELARRHDLSIIGDAAQAHGAEVDGRPVGRFGDAAAFSFYPSKNLGALGDGGAITTDDDALATRARRLRNYGSESKHELLEVGVNSRLDPLQAAFLRAKLRVLESWNARRERIADRYLDGLAGTPDLRLPARPARNAVHAWYAFCVRHPRRERLRDHLAACGIGTQLHYAVPPHRSPAFAHLGFEVGSFPVTERAAETVLSLPIGPQLDDDAVTFVIEATRAFSG